MKKFNRTKFIAQIHSISLSNADVDDRLLRLPAAAEVFPVQLLEEWPEADEEDDLDRRDEAEAEEEAEDAADGADEGHLGDLLLGDEHRHVRVLDEDFDLGQVLPGIAEDLFGHSDAQGDRRILE